LYVDQGYGGWSTIWRLFRGSLFHLSLHAAFSDFSAYAHWARGKEVEAATFAVSLVEDVNATTQAEKRWPGTLSDLAYANCISAMRLPDPNEILNPPLRFATKLLLSSSCVFNSMGNVQFLEENIEVAAVTKRVKTRIDKSIARRSPKGKKRSALVEGAQDIYASVAQRGWLPEVPYFPHTEAHGKCSLFEDKHLDREDDEATGVRGGPRAEGGRRGPRHHSEEERYLLASALGQVGLRDDAGETDTALIAEGREILAYLEMAQVRWKRVMERYERLVAPTRLEGLESPPGDYAGFLRVRASLAVPIRNLSEQLMLGSRPPAEEPTSSGQEGRPQLDLQGATQLVIPSQEQSDTPSYGPPGSQQKGEAWAILIDTSKSILTFSNQAKGMATCLGEAAARVIKGHDKWAMNAFNESIQVIKDFGEEYSTTTKARIGGIIQGTATLLPDAIQVTHRALMAQPASVRVLVVVSDGFASGYSEIDKRLSSVMSQVSRSGTMLMGIGVINPEVKEYFPVNFVQSTPYEVMKAFARFYIDVSSRL
jgi:hypothetical protein